MCVRKEKTLIVRSSRVSGEICIPPSKSQTHRAILFGAMGTGTAVLENVLRSPDTDAMLNAWQQMGVQMEECGTEIKIQGLGGKIEGIEGEVQAGNSGILLRFLTALGSLCKKPIEIAGDSSLCQQRYMEPLLDALRQLGAQAVSVNGDGYAPVHVKGPLCAGSVRVRGEDSQWVSALLIVSIFLDGTTEIIVDQPGELPWIDLTLDWLDRLSVEYERKGYHYFSVKGLGSYPGFEYEVPGDWSSAAFPLAAAIVTRSSLVLRNLNWNDCQGDKHIVPLLRQMGAQIEEFEGFLRVKAHRGLRAMSVDLNSCIDTLPILAVIACFAQGKSCFTGVAVARTKECDRIACMALELKKMGALVEEWEDGLSITGSFLQGGIVDSHQDHRIAMALAVAGLGAQGETRVKAFGCSSKTFPSFIKNFQKIGARFAWEEEEII